MKQAANEVFVEYEIKYVDLQRRPLPEIVTRLPASKKVKDKELRDLSKIIEKNLHVFENRLNVTAVQASYKVINSSEKDTPCVTVFVLGKGKIPVGETDLKKLDDNPFDVDLDIVEGYYQPCSNDHDYKSYTYPLLGGVGIGVNNADDKGVGTLGGFLEDENGKRYILSCEHVLYPYKSVNSNREIVQPAQIDFTKTLEDASSTIKNLRAKLQMQENKMEMLKTTEDPDIERQKERVTKTQKQLEEWNIKRSEIIRSQSPRIIGKYCCGLKETATVKISENCVNVYIDTAIGEYTCNCGFQEKVAVEAKKKSKCKCVKVYVDAAIAELNDTEAKELKLEKDDEPDDDLCPLYGFKNDKEKGFEPTGHIVELQKFNSPNDTVELVKYAELDAGSNKKADKVKLEKEDETCDLKLMKIGRTTGLTVDGEFESTHFFLNRHGYKKNTCAGNLCHIPRILYCNNCEPVNEKNQVDLSCIKRPFCTKCKTEIKSNVCKGFWAKNCMAIRRPKKPFCEEGDSGALVFDGQGRVWGMIFGVFSAEGINFDFGLATPLDVVLKALGRISGKTLTLW